MASLIKEYDNKKLNGVIYTPFYVVDKILDDIGYDNKDILKKSILDPACGDGRFLQKVIQRIIKFSSTEELEENLSYVEGWEIDSDSVEQCVDNLNELIKHLNISIDWNIKNVNSLRQRNNTFDYIVGNPPYVRIQHLTEEEREYIKTNYKYCRKGSTDLYIAFFELCHNILNEDGICGLITPNSWLSANTASELRKNWVSNKNLISVHNYGAIKVFDNVGTYTAITIFDKKKRNNFQYYKASTLNEAEKRVINFSELKRDLWDLSGSNLKGKRKLKDVCNIHVGVTTLMDKAYIIDAKEILDDKIVGSNKMSNHIEIEKEILKPIIKASTLKNTSNPEYKYIIFPYVKNMGNVTLMDENYLAKKYPLAYKYLESIKDELAKRDNGKPVKPNWYAYGRSQGLKTSFGKKILFSPMNKKPNFILCEDEECTFYSGYCIKYDGNYDKLLEELNSERMELFINENARDFSGGWKAYNKTIVQEFSIDLK